MIHTNATPDRETAGDQRYSGTDSGAESYHDQEFQWNSKPSGLFSNAEGIPIIIFGVVCPLVLFCCVVAGNFEGVWRLALLKPIETAVEAALLSCVPIGNYINWSVLCSNNSKHPIRNGMLTGLSFGTALSVTLVASAAVALSYPIQMDGGSRLFEFCSIILIGAASSMVSLCLSEKSRRAKETVMARVRTVGYCISGVLLSLALLAACEARSTCIRIAETYAVSDNADQQLKGLTLLRNLNPEKDIRLNCADGRTAGVAGLFLRLPEGAQQRLYFAATGKPFRDRKTTNMSLMSNDYLRRHVVGAVEEGLSLVRSATHGQVHPDTLSASLDWTFVFKNTGYRASEARAEIAVPEGAVLSGLTLWVNGSPEKAIFGAADKVSGTYHRVDVSEVDPALLTDLGRGRYLLKCNPVPAQGELKVSIRVTEPLKLDGSEDLSMALPRFIDTNFALAGHNVLRLRSSNNTQMTLNGVQSSATADGDTLLCTDLKDEELTGSSFAVRIHDGGERKAIAVKDGASAHKYIIEEVKELQSLAPRRLVVVIDGSSAVGMHAMAINKALAKLPEQIDTRILIANDNGESVLLNRQEGLNRLKATNFKGGRDNLEALVKAAEFAGESKGGAVLWIHGPQPGFNEEMYILAPYAAPPKFIELALDDCYTDANELFRNHREIGPFSAIVRNANVQDDLTHFFQRWQPGAKDRIVELVRTDEPPSCPVVNGPQSEELACLLSYRECSDLLRKGKMSEAAAIAVAHKVVTPVSSAAILGQRLPDLNTAGLSGASNGSMSANDAAVIVAINTAGTVRVNNLANLEAIVNILANCGEILGIGLGIFNVVFGALGKPSRLLHLSPMKRIIVGLCCALVGMAIPGSINWLVASARDANLFD